jgi:C-terminal processing protease CtpA/Prc
MVENGYSTIKFKVHGYWSDDPITIYLSQDFFSTKAAVDLTIRHSSGGRDTNEVECDAEAAKNFGLAMIRAGEILKYIQSNEELVPMIEKKREEQRIACEEAKKRKQDKIEADAPMGMEAAKVVVDKMIRMLPKQPGSSVEYVYYNRGDDFPYTVKLTRGRSNGTFNFHGGRKGVTEMLAEKSHRSHFAEASIRL